MKQKKLCYKLYVFSLLGVIIFVFVLHSILSFGVMCKREKPQNIQQFREFKLNEKLFSVYMEEDWRRKKAEKIFGKEYDTLFSQILCNVQCFPVLEERGYYVGFEDSWMEGRSYGGKRGHEGTDLMANKNERNKISIVSVSDGVIEKKGWLPQGGYRLGIRSASGAYFYYAHLASYAEGMEEGTVVRAGQVIGKMGDTGYGEEGTMGKFPVHLHFGIYVTIEGEEVSVNPYSLLKYLHKE